MMKFNTTKIFCSFSFEIILQIIAINESSVFFIQCSTCVCVQQHYEKTFSTPTKPKILTLINISNIYRKVYVCSEIQFLRIKTFYLDFLFSLSCDEISVKGKVDGYRVVLSSKQKFKKKKITKSLLDCIYCHFENTQPNWLGPLR